MWVSSSNLTEKLQQKENDFKKFWKQAIIFLIFCKNSSPSSLGSPKPSPPLKPFLTHEHIKKFTPSMKKVMPMCGHLPNSLLEALHEVEFARVILLLRICRPLAFQSPLNFSVRYFPFATPVESHIFWVEVCKTLLFKNLAPHSSQITRLAPHYIGGRGVGWPSGWGFGKFWTGEEWF